MGAGDAQVGFGGRLGLLVSWPLSSVRRWEDGRMHVDVGAATRTSMSTQRAYRMPWSCCRRLMFSQLSSGCMEARGSYQIFTPIARVLEVY